MILLLRSTAVPSKEAIPPTVSYEYPSSRTSTTMRGRQCGTRHLAPVTCDNSSHGNGQSPASPPRPPFPAQPLPCAPLLGHAGHCPRVSLVVSRIAQSTPLSFLALAQSRIATPPSPIECRQRVGVVLLLNVARRTCINLIASSEPCTASIFNLATSISTLGAHGCS